MWKPSVTNIEKMKNVLLVVLFLMTILLLYFFWINDSMETIFKVSDERLASEFEYKTPLISQVVQPAEISVCFGNSDSYTKVPLEDTVRLWQSAINEFREFAKSDSILVEEITAEQYQEIMKYRSVQFRFDYDIPFNEFLEFENISLYQNLQPISGMNTLAYSDGIKENIFIYQKKENKYYRLVSNSKEFHGFSKIIEEIEDSDYITYYSSGTYFGIDKINLALIPLTLQTNLQEFSYELENKTNANNKEKLKKLSESFFGESFDFIRRIADSQGAIIYMYGYGEKVFSINMDGTFEYKEEKNVNNNVQLGFYDALDISLQFVASRGGWESLNGAKLTPYLRSAKIVEKDKKKVYLFTFGMQLNNHRIYYQEGEPIEIEIYGNQVIRYKRNMIDFDNSILKQLSNADYQEAFPAVNVPAVNYEYLKNLLEKQKMTQSKNEEDLTLKAMTFDDVAAEMQGMEVGYLKTIDFEERKLRLQPVWILKMKKVDVYFDLYDTAEPIGYTYR